MRGRLFGEGRGDVSGGPVLRPRPEEGPVLVRQPPPAVAPGGRERDVDRARMSPVWVQDPSLYTNPSLCTSHGPVSLWLRGREPSQRHVRNHICREREREREREIERGKRGVV